MVSIKGIVIPADWDCDGNVIKLAIATGDEQEYLVENRHHLAKLKALLRQEVVVMGTIRHQKKHKAISVVSIRQEVE